MSNFEEAVNYVLKNEGGLNESPNDRGGITNFGISLRFLKTLSSDTLRAYGIFDSEVDEQTIRDLTLEQAKSIYHGEFWSCASFDKIDGQDWCNFIFDMAVNMGIAPAIKCVQRACWAVLKKWEVLKDDGILGAHTLAAISRCGYMIMPPLRSERGGYCRAIVATHPDQHDNLKGWYDRTYNR